MKNQARMNFENDNVKLTLLNNKLFLKAETYKIKLFVKFKIK
nr:hypothetical protein [uncultured archaeon]AQS29329.1 hypothetical protein [uncultured archaeon]